MKKVILFTSHRYGSKRKAGFHWLADAFLNKGFEVFFVTCLSSIDKIRGDDRFNIPNPVSFNEVIKINSSLSEIVFFELLRPVAVNKYFDKISGLMFNRYGRVFPGFMVDLIRNADVIVFESIYQLMYSRSARKINPGAKFIYRVSDDLNVFNYHEIARLYEKSIGDEFDIISSPSPRIHEKFSHLRNSCLEPHGVPTEIYDREMESPYFPNSINAIFAGTSLLDSWFVSAAAENFENINFHYIGPFNPSDFSSGSNIIFHGEKAYSDVVPFIKHANFGMNPLVKGGFGNSNKVQQYAYSGIPVVQSSLNISTYEICSYYHLCDLESVKLAIRWAISNPDIPSVKEEIPSWDSIVNRWICGK